MRDTHPYGALPRSLGHGWRGTRLRRILRATQAVRPLMDANAGTDVFDRILSASGPLVALKASDTTLLLEQFRLVARRTGQAVYLWRHAEGLVSLRDAQMRVPGCLRLGDARLEPDVGGEATEQEPVIDRRGQDVNGHPVAGHAAEGETVQRVLAGVESADRLAQVIERGDGGPRP